MFGLRKIYLVGAVVALLSSLGAWFFWQGHKAAIQDIGEQNGKAINAAAVAHIGYLECAGLDGVHWDFATGECRRSDGDGG